MTHLSTFAARTAAACTALVLSAALFAGTVSVPYEDLGATPAATTTYVGVVA